MNVLTQGGTCPYKLFGTPLRDLSLCFVVLLTTFTCLMSNSKNSCIFSLLNKLKKGYIRLVFLQKTDILTIDNIFNKYFIYVKDEKIIFRNVKKHFIIILN